MNPLLANIYQTHGGPDFEKVAAEGGDPQQLPETLSDLATMIVIGEQAEGDTLEKTAAAHGAMLEDLVELDQAGRMMAQAEFSEMEKMASEGDPSALLEFFGEAEGSEEEPTREQLQYAIAAELQRRGLGA